MPSLGLLCRDRCHGLAEPRAAPLPSAGQLGAARGGREVTGGVGLLAPSLGSHPAEKCPWSSCCSTGVQQGGSWGEGRSLPGGVTPAGSSAADRHRARDHPQVMGLCLSRGRKSHPGGSLCPAPCQKTEQGMDQLLWFLALSSVSHPCRSARCHPRSSSWSNDSPRSLCELRAPSSHSSQLILSSAIPSKPRAFPGADL